MIKWLFLEREYRIFEGFRSALTLTFISGFIDAYTYLTQGHSFAGMQTGNIIYLMIHLATKNYLEAMTYIIPIFIFILGQFFTCYLRHLGDIKKFHWHVFSSHLLFILLAFTSVIAPLVDGHLFPIVILSFYASMQVETFKRIRGMPYTSIMMTGNLRNLSRFCYLAWVEKDPTALKKARRVLLIIFAFMIGVFSSTLLIQLMGEWTLALMLFPIGFINLLLTAEVRMRTCGHK